MISNNKSVYDRHMPLVRATYALTKDVIPVELKSMQTRVHGCFEDISSDFHAEMSSGDVSSIETFLGIIETLTTLSEFRDWCVMQTASCLESEDVFQDTDDWDLEILAKAHVDKWTEHEVSVMHSMCVEHLLDLIEDNSNELAYLRGHYDDN